MEKFLVNRTAYTRLEESPLLVFVQNCLGRMKNNPVYAAEATAVTCLDLKTTEYGDALIAAENRGRDTMVHKRMLRKAVVAAMNRVVMMVELNSNGDPTYPANAGLPLRQTRRKLPSTPGVPTNVQLLQGPASGEAVVDFTTVEGARIYAVEWREAGQEAWQNGNYTTLRRVSIQVASKRDVEVQVRALGQRNQHSGWSEKATRFIL